MPGFMTILVLSFGLWAQNLRQGIIMKTSFKTRVLRMRLGSFVDINILVMKYLFLHILHFFRISQIKIYKMLRPQKRYSRVLLNDTLLNFGLRLNLWWNLLSVRTGYSMDWQYDCRNDWCIVYSIHCTLINWSHYKVYSVH